MKRQYTQTYSMLTCVVGFTTQSLSLIPKNSAASPILEELDSDVSQLREQAGDEVIAAVEALEQTTLDYASATAKRAAAIGEYAKTMEDAMAYLKRFDILVAKTLADGHPDPGSQARC